MSQVRMSDKAESDLVGIWYFNARHFPQAADRLVATLLDRCQTLADSPDMGWGCEELAPELRNSAVGNYLIFYRPFDRGIEVVRVLHAPREASCLFP